MASASNSRPNKGMNLIEAHSDYVVIDLETTGLDPNYDNIIEMAAVRIVDNAIVDRFQSLVYQQFGVDDFITELTGITDDMLKSAPPLADVMEQFLEFVGNSVIVAHNAHFDVNFIYDNCNELFECDFVNNFVDTMRVSRRPFKEEKTHTLSAIVERFKVGGNVEHRALADAIKTHLCYEYMKTYATKNNIEFVTLYPKNATAKDITTNKTEFDESSPVFGRYFAFTGILEKMQRKDAMQIVVDMGEQCGDKVNKKTNFLVLGNNDYCSTIKDGKSNKQKAAEKLALSGADIQTISENVFYDMIAD